MDEGTLLATCAKGDKAAFNRLILIHRGLIEGVVRRMVKDQDALKDVVQEILIRIFRNFHSFNGKSKLSTWIYRISMNESLRYLGRPAIFNERSDEILEQIPSQENDSLSSLVEVERHAGLRRGIERLSDEHRQILVMHYFEYKKLEDIAGFLDLPPGTVNSRLARAKTALKAELLQRDTCGTCQTNS